MAFHFTMDELFRRMDKSGSSENLLTLVPVTPEPSPAAPPGHGFIIAAVPRLLDLDRDDAAPKLTALLDEIPLYQVNMELTLDDALALRHGNAVIARALEHAFGTESLPSTLNPEPQPADGDARGNLRHPMLGHLEAGALCALYLSFLNALPPGRQDYGFARDIIGAHAERFTSFYDGFIHKGTGHVRAGHLLEFGARHRNGADHPPENHARQGQQQAAAMDITDPREMFWAWMEADARQMAVCADIDRVKKTPSLPRPPAWIRDDVFFLLRNEAMKQVFARNMAAADPGLSFTAAAPAVHAALQSAAGGQGDDCLQELLAHTLDVALPYNDSAGRFAAAAARRRQEARQHRLI